MKYKSGEQLMGLPEYIKFGCEIEVQNVDKGKLKKLLQQYPELEGWKIADESSLTDNGAEIISPPLSEKEDVEVYIKFQKVLDLIQSCPADKNREVYVNEQCGGHIHFDATKMRENPEMAESFLRLWAEAEELIYKICNDENEPIRESAVELNPVKEIKSLLLRLHSERVNLKEDIKDVKGNKKQLLKYLPKRLIKGAIGTIRDTGKGAMMAIESVILPNGFAHPIGKSLQKAGKGKDYIQKVVPTKKGNKFLFNKSLKKLACHEVGINLEHISTNRGTNSGLYRINKSKGLNTYEFRIHNSSLMLESWKKKIFLDAAFSKVTYEMAYEPGKNDHKLSELFNKDITEQEKIEKLMGVLFEFQEDRNIYRNRWESNKDAPIYKRVKGFSKTFKKEDIQGIAQKTKTREIINTMQKMFNQAKEFFTNEDAYIQPEKFVMDYGGRDNE